MTDPALRDQFRPSDHPNDHFLLTTVVGAAPKPKWHNRARDLFEDPEADFGQSEWEEAKDDAARLITTEHERSGLDVITDGEMRRNEMVEYFAERIEGYEFNGLVKVWGHNYFDKPSVRREVEYDESWLVNEYEFTSKVASKPVKVPITGPYTLATWCFNEVYEDDAELAAAVAKLVNTEIRKLVDAGARYIQIDEAALATTPEDYAIVGDCLETVVDGIPEDVYIGLHVCYGDYSRIYPEILEFPVDEFDLELNNGDYDQLEVFKEPTFTKNLGFGAVDVHTAEVESVEEIKANIKHGLEVVPPERLTISPDCGLKLLPREIAFGKMKNMVQATREIEAELDAGTLEVAD
ncbi:methionine synthase [Halostagnicola sp. A56]|uniref:methionine synthase n=1 Tax=Halostagnicola sp. A56 TaxID=1495067 RepID=UPI0004A10B23|nr:methionine synthase [Halostagnicola sp. A56]KDE60360.1 methionine synthase [Halostagnicola sp. A56]